MQNQAFKCVMDFTRRYNIDESHSLKHSMEVMRFAENIYESELAANPQLERQKSIIMASAILHDMCDHKYVSDEAGAIADMREYMKEVFTDADFDVVVSIITTMSYSKVKKKGYPDLGEYQLAYHIVREADLLAAYDIDRCIIYGMAVDKMTYTMAVERATVLFAGRVLKYRDDGLFVTAWSQAKSLELHNWALSRSFFK
jgi:HD superfamily phosphodiesterase